MPPYPYFRALYAVPVRQVRGLLTASFRFRLTADTLAVRLCASLLPTRTWDFHPLENAHAGQTKGLPHNKSTAALSSFLLLSLNLSLKQNNTSFPVSRSLNRSFRIFWPYYDAASFPSAPSAADGFPVPGRQSVYSDVQSPRYLPPVFPEFSPRLSLPDVREFLRQ